MIILDDWMGLYTETLTTYHVKKTNILTYVCAYMRKVFSTVLPPTTAAATANPQVLLHCYYYY